MILSHKFNRVESEGINPHLKNIGWSSFFMKQLNNEEMEQIPARVVGVRKNSFLVSQGQGDMLATMSGSYINDSTASYPAVGDWILLRESMITSVLTRKNVLSRNSAGGRSRKGSEASAQEQVIATNIDTAFIVCGLDRDFNLRRIERYLTMIYNCGIKPVIVLTKADLHQSPDWCASEVETVAFGVPIHLVSADNDDALSHLKRYLDFGQTAALIGSSGAGKSTLINRLYGEDVCATSSVSKRLGKGKHTTTNRDLIILPSGGMLIDNPGIREVGLGASLAKTDSAFPEIDELSLQCKFQNCSHTHEPGCQVQRAVGAGEITLARLKSYQKILNELSYFSERESKGAARVERERWKGVAQKIKDMKKKG